MAQAIRMSRFADTVQAAVIVWLVLLIVLTGSRFVLQGSGQSAPAAAGGGRWRGTLTELRTLPCVPDAAASSGTGSATAWLATDVLGGALVWQGGWARRRPSAGASRRPSTAAR